MKLTTRRVNGAVRLDMQAETPTEIEGLRAFIEATGGGTQVEDDVSPGILKMVIRVESLGYNDAGAVDSLALEAETPDP